MDAHAIISLRFEPPSAEHIPFIFSAAMGFDTLPKGNYWICPIAFDGIRFDCCIQLNGTHMELGRTYELPVTFTAPEAVRPLIFPGKEFTLTEGHEKAKGRVLRILPSPSNRS